jgi:hypothetical protein
VLITLGDRHHLDGLVVIGSLGDHLTELVDNPSHGVSSCGKFTTTEYQRISP